MTGICSDNAAPAVPTHPCGRCNSEKTVQDLFNAGASRLCTACGGRGQFDPINIEGVLRRIIATKGKNKGKLRASMTSPLPSEGVEAGRAYYVWRLARFHGGVDVTMPIMADLVVRGDPFKDGLNALADTVAKHTFGTDLAAAARWGKVLGLI